MKINNHNQAKPPLACQLIYLLTMLAPAALAGEVNQTEDGLIFTENFVWQGNHAASILNGTSTTVWWDESSWDVRGDTSFVSIETQSSEINNRFHLDIHKAQTTAPTDGRLSNTIFAVGGNGDSGVGVMHLDFQDILSARLRNPMLISEQTPGLIEFYATDFVTTGHWWEIAISPADEILGAEYSGVPGQGDNALPGPVSGSGGQLGPGHDSPQDSINLVSFGATDVPCITGWWTRFGLTRSVAGNTTYFVNQVPTLNDLMPSDPADADKLEHWRIEVKPNSMSLLIDENDNDQFELVETWNVNVPWSEVFVHFMAVAYQSDHHPQGECFLGHIRELKWRDITVQPVKYLKTEVYPKNQGIINVGRETGWLDYDIRDIQRFGQAVNGAPQPNLTALGINHSGRYCNDAGFPCFGNDSVVNLNMAVPFNPSGMQLAGAHVLTDHKRSFNASESPVLVSIEGIQAGAFVPASASSGVEQSAWIRRGLWLPANLLEAGNSQALNFNLGAGAYMDRIEVEFYYSEAQVIDLIFKDTFEADE